ncbi:MAG TPA: cache domain-containing protein [Nitrososphaera sp.]
MSSKSSAVVPVIIAAAIIAAAGIIAVAYVQAGENKPTGNSPDLRLLASNLEERIAGSVKVMELTGAMPAVRNTDSLSLVSTAQMGIPQDADPAKREVAKEIVATYGDVASIFFLTPDGNLYLGEPFEQQKQLPQLNYSDRDWYKGVSSTGDSYVSSVFMSAAIHEPTVAVAVPVHEQGTEKGAIGYWVAITNLDEIEKDLRQLGGNSRVIFVDHNGTEIADSARDPSVERKDLRSFSSLESVKAALADKSGSLVETVDGKSMRVSYAPVKAHPHTWAVVSMQPAS